VSIVKVDAIQLAVLDVSFVNGSLVEEFSSAQQGLRHDYIKGNVNLFQYRKNLLKCVYCI